MKGYQSAPLHRKRRHAQLDDDHHQSVTTPGNVVCCALKSMTAAKQSLEPMLVLELPHASSAVAGHARLRQLCIKLCRRPSCCRNLDQAPMHSQEGGGHSLAVIVTGTQHVLQCSECVTPRWLHSTHDLISVLVTIEPANKAP